MKKILLILFTIISINGVAQTGFPATQSMASANTKLEVKGAVQGVRGIINGVFTDTTAANSDYIDFYNGAQIYTRSDRNFWLRDSVLNMWILMAKYSDIPSGVNIYNSNGILTGNRTLTGLNNTRSLTFDSLDYLSVNRNGVIRVYMSSTMSSLYAPNGVNSIIVNNSYPYLNFNGGVNYLKVLDTTLLHARASYEGNIHSTFYPYSLVDKSYVDSLVAAAVAAVTGSQTLQQVFNREVGGSVLTKTDSILTGANTLKVITSSSGVNPFFVKGTTGFVISAQASTGYGVYSLTTGANATAVMGNNTGTSGTNTGIYGLSEGSLATTNRGGVFQAQNATNNYAIIVPSASGNVGFGTTSPSSKAMLDITSTTQGLLAPRMTTTERDAITSVPTGLMIWNTTDSTLQQYRGLSGWASFGGGSSGTNNANVGSGYRWLKPGTQEIKTSFAGFGILKDSTTNTDGITDKADTVNISTKAAVQKAIDSLKAALLLNFSQTSSGLQYDMVDNFRSNSAFGFTKASNGAGSAASSMTGSDLPDNWMYGFKLSTGTAWSGYALFISSVAAATPNQININSSYRYNAGTKLRLPALSDGTDNYNLFFGISVVTSDYGSITNGATFRYTSADSSGKWIMRCTTGGNTTEVASSTTVAANTDYELEVSVFGGSAYFYINGVLAGTISTNVPTGDTDCIIGVIKSNAVSGNSMDVYVDWAAEGFKKQ